MHTFSLPSCILHQQAKHPPITHREKGHKGSSSMIMPHPPLPVVMFKTFASSSSTLSSTQIPHNLTQTSYIYRKPQKQEAPKSTSNSNGRRQRQQRQWTGTDVARLPAATACPLTLNPSYVPVLVCLASAALLWQETPACPDSSHSRPMRPQPSKSTQVLLHVAGLTDALRSPRRVTWREWWWRKKERRSSASTLRHFTMFGYRSAMQQSPSRLPSKPPSPFLLLNVPSAPPPRPASPPPAPFFLLLLLLLLPFVHPDFPATPKGEDKIKTKPSRYPASPQPPSSLTTLSLPIRCRSPSHTHKSKHGPALRVGGKKRLGRSNNNEVVSPPSSLFLPILPVISTTIYLAARLKTLRLALNLPSGPGLAPSSSRKIKGLSGAFLVASWPAYSKPSPSR